MKMRVLKLVWTVGLLICLIHPGLCDVCNFEDNSTCGWRNVRHTADQLDWSVFTGREGDTGPRSDHTALGGTGPGHYLQVQQHGTQNHPNQTAANSSSALLVSETLPPTGYGSGCLEFWYFLPGGGDREDRLVVFLADTNTGQGYQVWSAPDGHDRRWLKGSARIRSSTTPFLVAFEGVIGGVSNSSVIALDDISYTRPPVQSDCPRWPPNAVEDLSNTITLRPALVTTTLSVNPTRDDASRPTEMSSATTPINYTRSLFSHCDFETNCGFKNGPGDFYWTRSKSKEIGSTPPKPWLHGDHTLGGGKDGHYVYVDSRNHTGQTAVFWTAEFHVSAASDLCLHFFYSMLGSDIGILRIKVVDANTSDSVVTWTAQSLQHDAESQWLPALVTLTQADLAQPFKIAFEATIADAPVTHNGRIAVDDITIFPGSCQEKTTAMVTKAAVSTRQPPIALSSHSEEITTPYKTTTSSQLTNQVSTGGRHMNNITQTVTQKANTTRHDEYADTTGLDIDKQRFTTSSTSDADSLLTVSSSRHANATSDTETVTPFKVFKATPKITSTTGQLTVPSKVTRHKPTQSDETLTTAVLSHTTETTQSKLATPKSTVLKTSVATISSSSSSSSSISSPSTSSSSSSPSQPRSLETSTQLFTHSQDKSSGTSPVLIPVVAGLCGTVVLLAVVVTVFVCRNRHRDKGNGLGDKTSPAHSNGLYEAVISMSEDKMTSRTSTLGDQHTSRV